MHEASGGSIWMRESSFVMADFSPSDVIGAEKVGFLCELLDTVSRKDLSAIVKEYIDKVESK